MHFFDFLQLQEDEQIELLWYNGEHIGTRKDGDFMMLLYQVEGFYVEVYYQTRERVIKRYLCFECTDLLEPYMKNIDLSPIYKYLNKKAKKREAVQDANSAESISTITLGSNPTKAVPNKMLSTFMSGIYTALFSRKKKNNGDQSTK